jgi:hypothetical protein
MPCYRKKKRDNRAIVTNFLSGICFPVFFRYTFAAELKNSIAMKEKILSELKTAVRVNGKTGISDKTLEAYANIVSAQITDESQIADAIKPHVVVLKEIQGNIDHVAAESVRAAKTEFERQKEELKKSVPPAKEPESKDVLTRADLEKMLSEKISEELKPYGEKLSAIDDEKKRTERRNEIASRARELGLSEEDMKYVTVPEEGDVAAFLTGFKQHLVERGLKPLDGGARQTANPADASERASEWLGRIAVDGGNK